MEEEMYNSDRNEYKDKEIWKNLRFKKHILKVVDKPVKWQGYELLYYFEDPSLNLSGEIRKEALDYFRDNKKSWWKIAEKDLSKYEWLSDNELSNEFPTGNMLSSQVSCINHLFILRKDQNLVTTVLQNIGQKIGRTIVAAEIIDDGYIEFEKMEGKNENPLNEGPNRKEGSKSTSIDAMMVGRKNDGKNILVLIEWKYTETYENQDCKFFPDYEPHQGYKKMLQNEDCPIKAQKDIMSLFYNPYYQLMRQTLLGWKMVKLNEYGCDEYINLHIIPQENYILRKNIVTPMDWKNTLKDPRKYIVLSPEELLHPLRKEQSLKGHFKYLYNRYIEKYT
jgi:hypothetical protein